MEVLVLFPHQLFRSNRELAADRTVVMVPNVYGMALYADGGLITTRPYVASSNDLLTMSDFPHGDWCATADALFWTFIERHRASLARNRRIGLLVRQLDRMPADRRKDYGARAARFLASLDQH